LIYFVVASLTLALMLAVVALIRQVRLRRALETLLRRLLKQWRSYREK
jgi:hypothetical protein